MSATAKAAACAFLVWALIGASSVSAQAIKAAFMHGVASGDPLHDSIILWSRITPRDNATSLQVLWEVSESPAFATQAAKGMFTTTAARDFTVKVEAAGLKPSKQYFYRFTYASTMDFPIRSPVGRFRLPSAPGKAQSSLRYAIFSCSNWGWGHFNAYDAASQLDLDFFLHLGDWIYEYGPHSYPSPTEAVRFQPAPLGLQPPNELLTLADYRIRHAFYRQDPGLQAITASAAAITAWDDHEVANDAWKDGAENHQTTEGRFAARKAAGVKAYHEWMPTRIPDRANGAVAFYRKFQFGNLATLMMLETRLSARTDPKPPSFPANDTLTAVAMLGVGAFPPAFWPAIPQLATNAAGLAAKAEAERSRANKSILGSAQLAWIRDSTHESLAARTTWQLVGQDTVMMDQYAPDMEAAIRNQRNPARKANWQGVLANLTEENPSAVVTMQSPVARWSWLQGYQVPVQANMRNITRIVVALARYKISWTWDSWSGYVAERTRFLTAVKGGAADAGAAKRLNAVIYGGDSHNAWAGVQQLENETVAVEFDTMSVSATGFEDFFPFIPAELLAAGFVQSNKGMAYANLRDRGFMVATLTHASHRVDFMKLDTVASQKYRVNCDASFETAAGKKELSRVPCAKVPAFNPYAALMNLHSGLVGVSSSALP